MNDERWLSLKQTIFIISSMIIFRIKRLIDIITPLFQNYIFVPHRKRLSSIIID